MASIHIRRGPQGSTWRVIWRTPEGAQRSRSFKDRGEAKLFRSEVEQRELKGRAPDPARGAVTLAVWADELLATKPLKPKTAATYRELLRSRILPRFGERQLRDLRRAELRAWVFELSGEVSPRRCRNALALLSHLLSEAVTEGLLEVNPAAGVPAPRDLTPEVQPWTAEELHRVAEAAGQFGTLILWLGHMGTRWAETVGLRTEDFRDGHVLIGSTLSEVGGRLHRVPPKTYAQRRLPVPAALHSQLELEKEGLVFTSPTGFALRSNAFRERYFYPACDRAGVRRIRVHDLRHTAASLLAQEGASPRAIQQWLGHSDIRTTLSIYTHVYGSDLAEIARTVDSRLLERHESDATCALLGQGRREPETNRHRQMGISIDGFGAAATHS